MEDLIITPEERKLLETVAATFGLSDRIVKQLEDEYNSALEEEEWKWKLFILFCENRFQQIMNISITNQFC